MTAKALTPRDWAIIRSGRRFYIQPLGDAADRRTREVESPSGFASYGEAKDWIERSLA